MPTETTPTAPERDDRAIIISVRDTTGYAPEELIRLASTLGFDVVGHELQTSRAPDRTTYFGSGRLAALAESLEESQVPTLLVDDDLSARQHREMERALNVVVLDRSDVILRIFERNARTQKARMEVELARLIYMLPRQRDDSAGDDRRGGGGRGERGHTNVQLSKERIRDRIAALKTALGKAEAAATQQRDRRSATFQVALVGYTNAGKSSLMRALTGFEVLVQDQLFATLGTTVRQLRGGAMPPVVLADTVGFIENLPHNLIASFQSTLDEASAADLLLIVVDASADAWAEHLAVTRSTLTALGDDLLHRAQVVFNKVDAATPQRLADLAEAEPDAWFVSALQPARVDDLTARIVEVQHEGLCEETLWIPYAAAHVRGDVFNHAAIVEERAGAEGWSLRVRAREDALDRWRLQLPPAQYGADPDVLVERAALHGLDLLDAQLLDESGLDTRVARGYDLDERRWILRAPRREDAFRTTRREHRALRMLGGRLPVDIPQWVIHEPELIAYPEVAGTPAWSIAQDGLSWNHVAPDNLTPKFLESLADFLIALQRVSMTAVIRAGLPVLSVDDVRAERRHRMAETLSLLDPSPELVQRWEQWLDAPDCWPPATTLLHGDFHPGHMMTDEEGRLLGVIDWTEARVADPGQDLAGIFASFGAEGLDALLEVYAARGGLMWPGIAEHVAKIWEFSPVEIAWWAQQSGQLHVVEYAKATLSQVKG